MHDYGFWTYFDFAAFLVLCTLISGGLWAFDAWVLAGHRTEAGAPARKKLGASIWQSKIWLKVVEYARSFFPVFLAVLVLRSFIVEPFKIPTGSMIPTLMIGDFILVNKFAYGIRLPVSHNKIIAYGSPKRGEVVVFRYPMDTRVNFIKRMIGLPGDTIEYKNKILYINGQKMNIEPQQGSAAMLSTGGREILIEDLDGVKHLVQHHSNGGMGPDRGSLVSGAFRKVVPEGHFFVMGDNRDESSDSRVWGFVPEENLVGKAFIIWFNLNFDAPWGEKLQWSRIGGAIE